MILSLTVKEVLKKHDISGSNVQPFSFSTATTEPCDLIIGTPEMKQQFSKVETPSLFVHSVFDKKEVEEKLAPYIQKWKQLS